MLYSPFNPWQPQKTELESASWMLTLGDLLSLMLCFFVLVFAMQDEPTKRWQALRGSFHAYFSETLPRAPKPEGIEQNQEQALPASQQLAYHARILTQSLEKLGHAHANLKLEEGRIILQLHGDVYFAPGSAKLNTERKPELEAILAAAHRTGLAMALVGHTDPTPVHGAITSNWQLSLARAAEVAQLSHQVGFGGNHKIWGVSAGDYAEISQDLALSERYSKARRVDIILTPR